MDPAALTQEIHMSYVLMGLCWYLKKNIKETLWQFAVQIIHTKLYRYTYIITNIYIYTYIYTYTEVYIYLQWPWSIESIEPICQCLPSSRWHSCKQLLPYHITLDSQESPKNPDMILARIMDNNHTETRNFIGFFIYTNSHLRFCRHVSWSLSRL